MLAPTGWTTLLLLAFLGSARFSSAQPSVAVPTTTSFVPVNVHLGDIGTIVTMFPFNGRSSTFALPPELPRALKVIGFSPDGRAIYVQGIGPQAHGVIKVGFRPLHSEAVPGSEGLGLTWSLVEQGRKMIVSGRLDGNGNQKPQCGTFEIDPDRGALRTLLAGDFPDCGESGGGGAISPDGKRAITYYRGHGHLVDLFTGVHEEIKALPLNKSISGLPALSPWSNRVAWSPDGKWIGASVDDKIVLLDTKDLLEKKSFRSRDAGAIIWSPDSNTLMLTTQRGCVVWMFFESIELLDITTGKITRVKSSHCEIGDGPLGWLSGDLLTAEHFSAAHAVSSGRLLTVDGTTARVRDYQRGLNLMSAGLGALTAKLLGLRTPPWLTDEDASVIALQISAVAERVPAGCRLSAGSGWNSDLVEAGASCEGQPRGGAVVINVRTGQVLDAESRKPLESPQAGQLARQILEDRRRQQSELREQVEAVCHQE